MNNTIVFKVKAFTSISLDKLMPFQGDLKKLSDKNFNRLRQEILEDGFNFAPHVWKSSDGYFILDGHQRIHVLKQLAKQGVVVGEVPCNLVEADTIEDAKRKVLQAVSQYGKLTNDGFLEFTEGLELDFKNFDFPDFTMPDLPHLEIDKHNEKDDEIPDVEDNPYGVQRGDIWQLGNHILMCGDSTSEDDVNNLMNGEKADICFTSPPYNAGSLNIKGNEGTKEKYKSFDDNQSNDEYRDFLCKNLNSLINNCNEIFYNIGLVQNNKRTIFEIINIFGEYFKDIIYWKKSAVSPHIQKGVINNLVEFIICFGDGKRKFSKPQFSQGSYWNVIEGPNAGGNPFAKIHKATFPIYLPENIISNFSEKKAKVIDCFMGTGTTLIACEKTDRKCYGMEIDPHYCSVIIKRWEDYTGQKAVKM
jgi:DNA modification methylase